MRVHGLASADADRLRRQAELDGAPAVLVDQRHSYPCRQCLRDGEPGEEMVLVRHDPFRGESPYTGPSPMYLHRSACSVYQGAADGDLPEQLTRRLLSVRGYDERHLLREADVVAGTELAAAAVAMLENPCVSYLHVHNAKAGCWAARIDRAG